MTRRLRSGSRRSCWALAVVVLALGASLPPTANAQETLAATCSGPLAEYDADETANERLAQTFVPSLSGTLTRAEIHRFLEPAGKTGDYIVQILAVDGTGTPTDTVLAQTTVAEVPEGEATLNAVFATPTAVVADQTYALSLSRPGAGTFAFRWGYRTEGCPGRAFRQPNGTGAWNEVFLDRLFSVYVTPEPEPGPKADRTIVLDANKNKVKKRKKVRLSGQVNATARQGPCESGQTVELQRKRPSQATFTTFAQVQTDAQGSFSLKKKVKKTFEYRAQVVETATCGAALSNSEKVKVKKKKK
jgi:hypothetical protein